MSTLLMRYGLLPPVSGADVVKQQMRLAHRYRNDLIWIERGRRAAMRALLRSGEDVPALEHALKLASNAAKAASVAVKAHKSTHHTRKVPQDMRAHLDATRVAQKDARAKLTQARIAARLGNQQSEADLINERGKGIRKDARAICGVYWGTYLLVEKAAAQSFGDLALFDGLEPNDPSFERWQGDGTLGVQLQGGLDMEGAFELDTQIQIRMERDTHTGEMSDTYATLKMRVGSAGKRRQPVWAEWPMKLHRPLPKNASIKEAAVFLRMRGPRQEWFTTLTLSLNEPVTRPCGEGVVAINLGWREFDDGIRVARWVDSYGREGELRLNSYTIEGCRKPEELQSTRDQNLNMAKAFLGEWFASRTMPDWMLARTVRRKDALPTQAQALHYLSLWRSQRRMAALVKAWSNNRFDGDDGAYGVLEAWRYRDHHLWCWESDQRTSSKRNVREIFRVFASELATRYQTIVLHSISLREFAKKPKEDEQEGDNEKARSNRHLVAPSELIRALTDAKRSREGHTVKMPVARITQWCYACDTKEDFDAAAKVDHVCSHCGAKWDQDRNAAKNLLKSYVERPGDAKIVGAAREEEISNDSEEEKEKHWDRVRRLEREKKERMGTPRKG